LRGPEGYGGEGGEEVNKRKEDRSGLKKVICSSNVTETGTKIKEKKKRNSGLKETVPKGNEGRGKAP